MDGRFLEVIAIEWICGRIFLLASAGRGGEIGLDWRMGGSLFPVVFYLLMRRNEMGMDKDGYGVWGEDI